MKSFTQLSKRGQARRLRGLVINALDQYDLDLSRIQLVGLFTNAIFRLRARDGRSYIMRICRPSWRTKTDLVSEIMWLQALHRETVIPVPEPIPARSGEFFVEASAAGVPESRRCVIMSWLPGPLLATRLNEGNLYKMGVLFAKLHTHGTKFDPPEGFTTRQMDSIFARGEPDVLFSDESKDAFTVQTAEILKKTNEQVKGAFSELNRTPAGLQVIHNDLHHENIKIYHGKLAPFDFEDTIWGHPVQDIAMAMQDLMGDVAPDQFDPLQSAFRSGYETEESWPEHLDGQIDTFRVGRMLWVANYVARYQRQYLRAHVDWLAPQLQRYLDTGLIRKI